MADGSFAPDGAADPSPHRDDRDSPELDEWRERGNAFVRAELLRYRVATSSLIALSILAGLAFAAIVWRTFPSPTWQAIALLLVAVLCAAVPLLSKLSLSKDGSAFDFANPLELFDKITQKEQAARAETFEETRRQISALSQQLGEALEGAQAVPVEGTGLTDARLQEEPDLRQIRRDLPPPRNDEDPQKGRFGGSSKNATRRLTARTEPSNIGRKWRKVILTLESLDGAPIEGRAAYFFLHDTFDPDVYRVAVKPGERKVVFKTTATGGFTAGVVAERGTTKLEIDLAGPEVEAPQAWKDS